MGRKLGIAAGRAERPHPAVARHNALLDYLLLDPLNGGLRTIRPTVFI